ncbi:hypothetical protein [Botrimarina mediterranea]|uniref:Uncharacterized protein n=1 Tax=Botrimarina mediterranea TaxID=2528022 RepID=A0A518KDG4_9BACT|nr:hypothetical protein [Botrimarina mediterranea]QDV75799.1 hypothetical protein Spa11_40220 [Botrimarina mediterranea]QDV80396.1 hypothetical protein K2D_40250 [Planctomycetes bacterium K2D]
MNATTFLVLRTALTVAAFPGMSMAGNCLLNPVTTYTNGMPLASSTSMRSHNVYWQGDPERIGECDGRYNCPCLNDLHCRRTPYIGGTEPRLGQVERLPDGMEEETAVVLGVVSIDPTAPPRRELAPLPAAPAAPAAEGGVWIDALQSLQRKIMIDPERGY